MGIVFAEWCGGCGWCLAFRVVERRPNVQVRTPATSRSLAPRSSRPEQGSCCDGVGVCLWVLCSTTVESCGSAWCLVLGVFWAWRHGVCADLAGAIVGRRPSWVSVLCWLFSVLLVAGVVPRCWCERLFATIGAGRRHQLLLFPGYCFIPGRCEAARARCFGAVLDFPCVLPSSWRLRPLRRLLRRLFLVPGPPFPGVSLWHPYGEYPPASIYGLFMFFLDDDNSNNNNNDVLKNKDVKKKVVKTIECHRNNIQNVVANKQQNKMSSKKKEK